MALLKDHPHFRALEVPEGYDGLTTIPSEEELLGFGFRKSEGDKWYFYRSVGSDETLNITIRSEPVGRVLLVPVYAYKELVLDESFGQPAYFGAMRENFRSAIAESVSSVLSQLTELGLQIEVDPREYGWKNWPESERLTGVERDRELIHGAEKH